MIAGLALVAAMSNGASPTLGKSKSVLVGDWTYQVHYDSFTGQRVCRLRGRHSAYRRGVLVFSLGPRIDTAGALYRIDAGPVFDPHADDLEIAAAGEPLHADDLDNASAGLVRIPAYRLLDARLVSIRPTSRARVVSFQVAGLRAALAQEAQAGCLVETTTSLPGSQSKLKAAEAQADVDQAAGLTGAAGSGAR